MAQLLANFTRFYISCPIPDECICTICDPERTLIRHGDLNKHLKRQHQHVIGWQCVDCNEQFDDIRSCKAHQRHMNHGPNHAPAPVAPVGSPDTPPIQATTPQTPTVASPHIPLAASPQAPLIQPTASVLPNSIDSDQLIMPRAPPNNNQRAWMTKFINCLSVGEVDTLFNEWISNFTLGPDDHILRPARSAGPARVRMPMTAARLQKLYRTNRPKAMNYVNSVGNKQCLIPLDAIKQHFANTLQPTDCMTGDRPDQVPIVQAITDEPLDSPFTLLEISSKLLKASNSTPGEDGISYRTLRRNDPNCYILHTMYNKCRALKKQPSSWKRSSTILTYKKGPESDIGNWRPIALSGTTAKLYASCIADRLMKWGVSSESISKCQKGFMPTEGCLQHNFHLHSLIEEARRTGRKICVAWLDLTNAFGSIPHDYIIFALKELGLGDSSLECIRDMYDDCSTSIKTPNGLTDEIVIQRGVKQGCPSSPIIFNLALELVIRAVTSQAESGFNLFGLSSNILVYADDIVLIAESESSLQHLLNIVHQWSSWAGLEFNASKCATLTICGATRNVSMHRYDLGNSQLPALDKNDSYVYLGASAGFKLDKNMDGTIRTIELNMSDIDSSLLAPWQKIDAFNTFVLSKLGFALRTTAISKTAMNNLDKSIVKYLKKWSNLPKQASTEVLYIGNHQGGLNSFPLAHLYNICTVVQAAKMLSCEDDDIKSLAMKLVSKIAIKDNLDAQWLPDITCNFLNGLYGPNIAFDGGDIASLWSRARAATRKLSRFIDIKWIPCNGDIKLTVNGNVIVDRMENALRTAIKRHLLSKLTNKPDQGKVYEVSSKFTYSNYFYKRGGFIRFADWRFITKARLNCLPLNGCKRSQRQMDKRCRICGYVNETLPHVINHCNINLSKITARHDDIQNRLLRAIGPTSAKISINKAVAGSGLQVRPDIVIQDDANKRTLIVDIACPFDNKSTALAEARIEKIRKYQPLVQHYQSKGFECEVLPFVVGALGSWDPFNEITIRKLQLNRRFAIKMRWLMVADAIRHSRDIYTSHINYVNSAQQT